jgi:hypothetical protein
VSKIVALSGVISAVYTAKSCVDSGAPPHLIVAENATPRNWFSIGLQFTCPVGEHPDIVPGGKLEFHPENKAIIEKVVGLVAEALAFFSPKWTRTSPETINAIRRRGIIFKIVRNLLSPKYVADITVSGPRRKSI